MNHSIQVQIVKQKVKEVKNVRIVLFLKIKIKN